MGGFDGIGGALVSGGFDLLGKGIEAWTSHNQREQEYARQKEFATHGIRWRVADAKAAGIHPIYAIGANTPTYSPQSAIGTDLGLSDFGQNIGRAIEAKQTREERQNAQEVANDVGKAQASYYRAAANNQQAQADLAGQRSVTEALQDTRSDVISQMASSSERQIRTQQQQPPMAQSSSNPGMDKPTPRYDFEYNAEGKPVRIGHSQSLHDKYEDMFILEYIPFVQGFITDIRYKITKEPILGHDGIWRAWNDEYFAPIDIKSYRPKWRDWLRTHAAEITRRYGNGSSRRPADWTGG